MTVTLRAVLFGAAVAASLIATLDTVTAAESTQVVRLDTVHVVAHRDAFDAVGNLRVIRLDSVVVVAQRATLA